MMRVLAIVMLVAQIAFAQESPHGDIKIACDVCHGTDSWKMRSDSPFDHKTTGFVLEGGHKIAACASCHQKLIFAKQSPECSSCHVDAHKSELGPNCLRCHTTTTWLVPDMREKHGQTRFPLTGSHKFVECEACHARSSTQHYAGTPIACVTCHQAEYKATTQPNHAQAGFGVDCATCHLITANWPSGFDHNSTSFPLTGGHRSVACVQCHKDNNFKNAGTKCFDCHAQNFASALSPNHVSAGFDHNCQTCHTTAWWQPSTFNHNTTAFPLTGKHNTITCQSCHTNGNYQLHYTSCYQCHQGDFQAAANPNHVSGNFSHDCTTCHNNTAWSPATFDHSTTAFPLTGSHVAVQCITCHVSGNYTIHYTDCYQCHTTNFTGVVSPNHVQGNFSHNCTPCHNTTAWSPSTFDHNTTHFALTGKHLTITCQSCHTAGNYQLVYNSCYQCHSTDFSGTTDPNHVAGNFSHDCTTCHSTTAWSPSTFDHNTTHFALTGKHATITCQSCHTAGNYQLVYSSCFQCHQTDFNGAANPNHVAGNFSHDCTTCHNFTAWSPATFDHSATAFPLTGAHVAVQCISCHVNGDYTIHYTNCYQCHSTNFTGATSPNHVSGNFSHDCTTCHNTTAWSPSTFDHNTTHFPLTGRHTSLSCQTCHTSGNYQLVYTDCYQCHSADYQRTTDPNHVAQNFSHNCTQCHNTSSWGDANFNHTTTRFPLSGSHTTLLCQTCHVAGNYQVSYTNCSQCHVTQYYQTTNPNHKSLNFSTDCSTCHTTTVWTQATFDHSTTAFALTGSHVAVQCITCHVNGSYTIRYTNCYQCHTTDFTTAATPSHLQGNFSHDCTTCHNTSVWSPSTFDHNSTHFALSGKHTTVTCQSCHTSGNYQIVYSSCYQCHNTDFAGTTDPNHVTGNFSHDCTTCHNTTVWSPSTFDHNSTHFALTGKHQTITCQSCHIAGNYQLVYSSCFQCHQTDFNGTTNPNHVTGVFSHDCTTCHNYTAWSPATFDHSTTAFPLTGSHIAVQCITCHVSGDYTIHYTNCYQCHTANFTGAATPNHVQGNFSHDCTTCHNTTAWSPSTFDHNSTHFALTGKHVTITCQSCHTSGNYQLVYSSCYQCHNTDFAGTTDPNHVTGNFSHDCTTCHNTTVWSPSTFDHNTTHFALTGKHLTITCQSCHTAGNYQLVYSNCFQCHQTDFNGTTNPNHVTGVFSHDCTTCHNIAAWSPATFDHATTAFPLTGAHVAVQCISCHTGGNYAIHYTSCYQCHTTDFTGVVDPSHVQGQFSHDCTTCHNTTAWNPSTFDHNSTHFALTGAHTSINCQECHASGNYQLVYSSCYQCHNTDFASSSNPDHTAGNFSHDCTTCHSTTAWSPATFDHNTTHFPLTGKHSTITCQSCHISGNYQIVYTDCYQCHSTDFTGATTPNHVQAAFSHTCTTCHNMTAWSPSTFDHNTTHFVLTGAHTSLACQSCHVSGNYALAYTDCYQCHNADFARPTNPNHVQANFSHDCTGCHSTTTWNPSTLNHDGLYFKINSGRHNGTWTLCTQCHTTVTDYSQFSCTTCHEHSNQTEVNNDHHGVSGYTYTPTSCYSCHKTV